MRSDDKIKSNVEQPETPVEVRGHTRQRPTTGEHTRINRPQEREGTRVVGGGPEKGVTIMSKDKGQSDPETKVEIGLDQNERDQDGRRVFH